MKRLKFKNPLKGLENALTLIPESYKVDGKEFEMTDGNETYRLKWATELNEATVLTSSNKSQINEDMVKMKHLMGFSSKATLGTIKGAARLEENNRFNDILGKAKNLLSESISNAEMDTAADKENGFSGAGNLEGNTPLEEEPVNELLNLMKDKDASSSEASDDDGEDADGYAPVPNAKGTYVNKAKGKYYTKKGNDYIEMSAEEKAKKSAEMYPEKKK